MYIKVVLTDIPEVVVSSHDGQGRKVGVAAVYKVGRFNVHDVGETPVTLPPIANKLDLINEELANGVNRMEL